MSGDQDQNEGQSGLADAGHAAPGIIASRMSGAQAAMNAIAGRGLYGVLGDHAARVGEDMTRRLGIDAVTAVSRSFDVTKLAGLESISERVSAAATSWMTSSREGHGAFAVAAALKFDGFDPMPGVQAAISPMAGPSLSDILGKGRFGANLIGCSPGLDAIKAYESTALAGAVPQGVTSGLAAMAAAALKVEEGVGRVSAVQAAMYALSSPRLSGLLGGDYGARSGMDWASGELGRYSHVLKGLLGAGGAMADQLSIFDKMMGDSQRAMHEAMGQWSSSMRSTAWMTKAMRGPAESIAAMMRGWSILADGGHWAARLALRMALAAKRAVMRGDIDAVKRFLCDWLGFSLELVTLDLVNSASLVLLEDQAWLPDDALALDYDPCPKLRKLTLAEHRSTRLIIDPRRRANHQPVISLNEPISSPHAGWGSTTTLLELVSAKPRPELMATEDDISDPRVLRVLAKLTDRERRIAEERGHAGTTWAEAAVACGGTAGDGERLRRKVKRLSKSVSAPAAAPCLGRTETPGARAVGR